MKLLIFFNPRKLSYVREIVETTGSTHLGSTIRTYQGIDSIDDISKDFTSDNLYVKCERDSDNSTPIIAEHNIYGVKLYLNPKAIARKS